jgi:hypothetical protein
MGKWFYSPFGGKMFFFPMQNSTHLKYEYDIHNQHIKLHLNDMLLRIFEEKVKFCKQCREQKLSHRK